MQKIIYLFIVAYLFTACNNADSSKDIHFNEAMQTYSNYEKVTTTHLDWNATIDFDKKQIEATATWKFNNPSNEKTICFDINGETIKEVKVNGTKTAFSISSKKGVDSSFGAGLEIPISINNNEVSIEYVTGANADALQWLAPSQTAGGKLPYLFTQCESIHARSLLPCQDVPANRITYNAHVKTPQGMLAVMSAKNPTQKNEKGEYDFEMEIPISTYLIALAVGDIEYKAIDAKCGVYTEPSQLQKSFEELQDMPKMIAVAEKLGGPYKWGKYDVLIAPPSFPIGGMENPRLTFATPTIIAGDKSLVSLIAHELAHSWSGNLVTNATWNDLWLNEGFTTYFERRIMEEISGKEYNEMLWQIGYQDMESDFKDMGKDGEDTKLRIELDKRNPEDAFSNIPYEKGAIFLRMLEENVGREKFNVFINNYFQQHAFQTMTTEKCLEYMHQYLFDNDTKKEEAVQLHEWVYGKGLPTNAPKINAVRFANVDVQRMAFEKNNDCSSLKTTTWSTHEWLHFLRKLAHPLSIEKMELLDKTFHLTETNNSEIADEWFKLAINSGYEKAFTNMELFLSKVGRKKFLIPLYSEMKNSAKYNSLAKTIFEKYKNNYHPQTASKINSLLAEK